MRELVVVVALACASPAAAAAEPFRDPDHHFQISIPDHVELAAGPQTSAAARILRSYEDANLKLVISRSDFSNQRAWRKDAAFFKEVEAGFAKVTPGFRALRRRQHKLGTVPALDLVFRYQRAAANADGLVRFLFFRRYTLMLVVSSSSRRTNLQVTDSFRPYFTE